MATKIFQAVKNPSKIELAKRKSPEPESGSDDEHEIEPEREQPVPVPSELEFADIELGEDYISSEGLAGDIPDESVVDTESSDGHVGLHLDDDMSDGDHEKDEDYVMESDDGDNASDLDPDDDFDLPSVLETTKKPSDAKFKESFYFFSSVTTMLKLTRIRAPNKRRQTNPSEATSARQSTMCATPQLLQETPPISPK